MNNEKERWAEVGPEPRTAGRRFIDTQEALDYARSKGASTKRIAVLEKGYAMLDAEFSAEVRADLTKDLFQTLGEICRPVSSPTAQHA
jgi:hypothetical protein